MPSLCSSVLDFLFEILFSHFLKKTSEIFPCALLLGVVDEMFIKKPLFKNTATAMKNSSLHP